MQSKIIKIYLHAITVHTCTALFSDAIIQEKNRALMRTDMMLTNINQRWCDFILVWLLCADNVYRLVYRNFTHNSLSLNCFLSSLTMLRFISWRTNHKTWCWWNRYIIKTVNGDIILEWWHNIILIFLPGWQRTSMAPCVYWFCWFSHLVCWQEANI